MPQVDEPTNPASGAFATTVTAARSELAQALAIVFRTHSFEEIERLGAEGRLDALMPVTDVASGALLKLPDWDQVEQHDGASFGESEFAAYLESLKT